MNKHNVTVEEALNFFKTIGVYDKVEKYILEEFNCESLESFIDEFRNKDKYYMPSLLSVAFDWEETQEGYDYWEHIDDIYRLWATGSISSEEAKARV